MSPVISNLQLKTHFFPVVDVRANPNGKQDGLITFDQNIVAVPEEGKVNQWHLELILNQKSSDANKPFIYEFEIHVVGIVEIIGEFPEDKKALIATVNGLGLLYGAAREMILNITSRSVFGPLCLPSLNFAEALKQAKETAEKQAQQTLVSAQPAVK